MEWVVVIVGIRFEILFEILLDLMDNDDSWYGYLKMV